MDYNAKSIYADSLVFISLELYLGKDHKFYKNEFPEYIKQNFEENQILPDLVTSFGMRKIGNVCAPNFCRLMKIKMAIYLDGSASNLIFVHSLNSCL